MTLRINKYFEILNFSLLPSFRRAAKSFLGIFAFPLFVISVVSTLSVIDRTVGLSLGEFLDRVIEIYRYPLEEFNIHVAAYGLRIHPLFFELGIIWMSVGSALARSEADEILSVIIDPCEQKNLLKQAFREKRFEIFFLAFPQRTRHILVRILWPLLIYYRFEAPYVVEGPGPQGHEISSVVSRHEIVEFIEMLKENQAWDDQSVSDQRIVLILQVSASWASAILVDLAL